MSCDSFDPRELTKEKKLWDIYIASRRIPASKFNFLSTLIVTILLVVSVWIGDGQIRNTIETIRKFTEIGLGVSLSTLGFLLAGFTIFATVSQPLLLVSMAKINHPDSGLSYLKHNFFIFIRVFIYYLVFAGFCLIVMIFGHKKGLVSILASLSPNPEKIIFILVNGTYIVLFAGYYFLLMQLKSFVFNIYHAVMTSIRWNAEGYDKE
jgi:hypothetical protein